MELVKVYSGIVEKRISKVEEELGECHEVLFNAHSINKLRAWARPNTSRVFINGVMLMEGHDYHLLDNEYGSHIQFIGHNSVDLRNSSVEVFYEGFTKKGEDNRWRW